MKLGLGKHLFRLTQQFQVELWLQRNRCISLMMEEKLGRRGMAWELFEALPWH